MLNYIKTVRYIDHLYYLFFWTIWKQVELHFLHSAHRLYLEMADASPLPEVKPKYVDKGAAILRFWCHLEPEFAQ